jgi:thioesterase domain-containing protein
VAEDPASIMFTSGTTGLPKGVAFAHGTFLASALFFRTRLGLGPGDRMAMTLPWAFAAGQELTVAALVNGATVCVRDLRVSGTRDAVAWMQASRVTTLHGTPSLLRSLMGTVPAGQVLESVRMVTTAGEKLHGRDVEAIRAHVPAGADVVNYLGSSETGVFSAHVVPGSAPVPEGTVPAGTGIPLREATVVGDDGRPVGPDQVGELSVASRHLSRGYWNDLETTRKRFSRLPDGRTSYLSGDRALVDGEGVLHLLGRADDAVKIRGYLVEPSEVEAALRRVPGVADTVVRALQQEDGTARLVAWVAPDPHERTPSPTTVRTELSRTLPDYMVPRDVVLVPRIPESSSGKADPGALPEPPPRPEPVAPRTPWEQRVERVWASVLGLERVGRDESFTALGGDSLAVEEMLAVLADDHRVTLTTADLAQHPALEAFAARAAALHAGRVRSSSGSLVRLRSGHTRPPVHCFAGAGAQAAYFEAFAAQLGPDQPVDAFQVNGFENVGVPDWTVRRTARRYVRSILQLAPGEPAVLVGHSLGGLVALEAAHLLTDAGVDVPLVVLLDTYLPPRARPDGAPWTPEVHSEVATTERGLWRTRLQVVTAGLWPHRDPEVRKEVFHEHGTRIAHFHRPRPWAGRTLLFTSIENGDDPAWWAPFLVGGHEVHRMPCDHIALLRRPYVDAVAARVAAEVDAFVTRT